MANTRLCPNCGATAEPPGCASCGAELAERVGEFAASERDIEAEIRDRAAEARDREAADLTMVARERERITRQVNEHDQSSSNSDEGSSVRDQRSSDDDQRSADDDQVSGSETRTHQKSAAARDRSRRERESAALSRGLNSVERLHAHEIGAAHEATLRRARDDRVNAANDRLSAAEDRERAAGDRAEALQSRAESMAAVQRSVETLESMSDAFFTLDSTWRFTYLNPQAIVLLGRRDDLIGKDVWVEFPDAVGSTSDSEYRRALEDQVPVYFEQVNEPLEATFDIRAFPITGGLAVYLRDITNQRLLDRHVRQIQRLESLGRVTAGVAHDFNNMLVAISGFAALGRDESENERVTKYFEHIYAASEKAAALTRKLLAFSRERDVAPRDVDLNEIVEGMSALMRQLMPFDVDLRLALSPGPVIVSADPSQLEQVLMNLVVNGRDSIGAEGSITIETGSGIPAGVTSDIRAPSGWIQIKDTGCGMSEELLLRAFEPFFTTKTAGLGSGLGLATVNEIISHSGGTIVLDSTVGTGTTVTVALPVERPPAMIARAV